ncbi:hypothetical protein P24_01755 [Oceanibaculum indicum P24]|uniref:Uncharacterized protein n=1 Tax=Oceanibaculum indicum P24 TaxID=1207063 RepID=K2J7G0_9PROT|nr:hypothetical protein P24_01755 [Oceanibaculum indicum P24]
MMQLVEAAAVAEEDLEAESAGIANPVRGAVDDRETDTSGGQQLRGDLAERAARNAAPKSASRSARHDRILGMIDL